MLSRGLTVPDGVRLVAEPGTVTLTPTAANRSTPMLLAVRSGVTIEGVSFDGGGAAHANGANVLQGYKVHDVTFERIAVRHSRGVALVMSTEISRSVVRDSVFEDIGNGWKRTRVPADRRPGVVFCCGAGNRGNSANGNRFSDIGLDALQFSDQSGVEASRNRFDLEDGQLAGLPAPDYPAALFLMRVDHAAIRGNVVDGAQGNCVDAPALVDSVIADNELRGCGASGVGVFDTHTYGGRVDRSARVEVSGNRIGGVGRWARASAGQRQAIFVTPGGEAIRVLGNETRD